MAVDPVFRRSLFQREVWRRVSSFLFSLPSPEVPQTNPVQGLGERQKRLEKVSSPLEERGMLAHKTLQDPNLASGCNSPIGTSRKHAASTEKLMLQMKGVEKRAERKINYKWIAIVQ